MSTPCRTLIVDDDADMAYLAMATVEVANDGLVVSGVALNGTEAMEKLHDADVVVLDFRMPGRNGLDVASDILATKPDQAIVLFSAYLDDATVTAAEQLGIRACVSKDRIRDLPDVIRRYCPNAA